MKQRFNVYGMTCSACQAAVSKAVNKLGVDEVNVNLINESMSVDYDPNKLSDKDIIDAVSNAGYEASLKYEKKSEKISKDHRELEEENMIYRLKISIFFMLILMYVAMGPMVGIPIPTFLEGVEGAVNNAFLQSSNL